MKVAANTELTFTYTVTLVNSDPAEGGTFSANELTAKSEEIVILEDISPADGYKHSGWIVTYSGGNIEVVENKFTMPAGDVTVYGIFNQKTVKLTHKVYLENEGENPAGYGTFSATPTTAQEEDTITLTAWPAENYRLVEWTVTNGDHTFQVTGNTFAMPAGAVTVSATFAPITVPPVTYTVTLAGGGQATLDKNTQGQEVLTLNITADGKPVGQVLGGVKVIVPYAGGGVNTVAMLKEGARRCRSPSPWEDG